MRALAPKGARLPGDQADFGTVRRFLAGAPAGGASASCCKRKAFSRPVFFSRAAASAVMIAFAVVSVAAALSRGESLAGLKSSSFEVICFLCLDLPGGRSAGRAHCLLRSRKKTFTLKLLARQLALTANGFGLLANTLLGGLFVSAARLELAEETFALHLLLQ